MTHMFPREGASSSSTSMSSQRSETHDDRMIAMVLSEEYAKLDGAMAKHLINLTSIPHVPRINTYFPTYSDATMDHYRLLDRSLLYPIVDMEVPYLFRAFSDQLYRSPDYYERVRKEIVKQLKKCNTLYEGYVPMKYKKYCKKMKKSGEWGDHVTLQAAADKFAAKICLLTSFRDTCFVEIVPQYQAPQREIWLSFWSEIHYNSLYDARDLPSKYKPMKKHWLLF
ncbi:OTU domain-containing protein [Zea mays]|uniref:ubiquitinyl hydrolase 1 n=1 Tax=Zea mays TaxID=4577 RepID=A0A3L6G4G2_MAIZE|nr:OTU domain-containing protein [Zea mays]